MVWAPRGATFLTADWQLTIISLTEDLFHFRKIGFNMICLCASYSSSGAWVEVMALQCRDAWPTANEHKTFWEREPCITTSVWLKRFTESNLQLQIFYLDIISVDMLAWKCSRSNGFSGQTGGQSITARTHTHTPTHINSKRQFSISS